MDNDTQGREFPKLLNDKILRTAKGEKLRELPVWIMRQAGRYLPEYQQTRGTVGGFFELCHSTEKASEVTQQPIHRYNLDAAIIFCDILVIPIALGLECIMVEKEGPSFPEPLRTPADLSRLKQPQEVDVSKEFSYVLEALSLTRHQLKGKVPLIGFCGGPWTLMAYMIEGGGSKTFTKAKSWLYQHPSHSHELLNKITDVIIPFLVQQVRHGAQLLQVFESWSGELSPEAFDEFLLPYLIRIEQSVREQLNAMGASFVPLIIFPKGAHYSYEKLIAQSNYDVISLDWQADIPHLLQLTEKYNRHVCFQGNLDPAILFGDADVIKRETRSMIEKFGSYKKHSKITHICNLGHGLQPTHHPDHVGIFIDAVHEISRELFDANAE